MKKNELTILIGSNSSLFIRNTIASLSLDKSNYRVLIVLNGDMAEESFKNKINEVLKKTNMKILN